MNDFSVFLFIDFFFLKLQHNELMVNTEDATV